MKPIRIISRSTRDGVLRIIVSSASDARRRYTVTITKRRRACSCKIWIFRRGYLRRKFPKLSETRINALANLFRCKHLLAPGVVR